ncbi:OLC1v1014440C1 [Oldenlandia corymbosa var. corymbosa]|uniref:OLC1v1014440C1 n=1 Tax=Oldenlandia corymbosa var. corymbosa TaxID=529605 RepID=A0AAV1E119_OLDCO|nr:OLC1v1014440C1 [Oldenlandia corymbosa var. corymbosa]
MALRSSTKLRAFLINRLITGNSSFATSTVPKMKPHAQTADAHHGHGNEASFKFWPIRPEYAPVYVALGLIGMSISFGALTVRHHIKWAPNVRVKKSKRETVPEVVEPETVVEEANNFVNNSFFRKVAHVQDYDRQDVIPDPIRGDVYSRKNTGRVETLKDVGVEVPKDPNPYGRASRQHS